MKTMNVVDHYEAVIDGSPVASFRSRWDAADFVRSSGGYIRMVTKTILRPLDWWLEW